MSALKSKMAAISMETKRQEKKIFFSPYFHTDHNKCTMKWVGWKMSKTDFRPAPPLNSWKNCICVCCAIWGCRQYRDSRSPLRRRSLFCWCQNLPVQSNIKFTKQDRLHNGTSPNGLREKSQSYKVRMATWLECFFSCSETGFRENYFLSNQSPATLYLSDMWNTNQII